MKFWLTLIVILILEVIYYIINRVFFRREFNQINIWEWVLVVLIIPSIFAYLYYEQSNQIP